MTDIYSFQIGKYTVDMTLREGFLAYVFQRINKKTKMIEHFGQKIKIENNDPMTLVSASSLLIINAYETINLLDKPKRKPKDGK